MVSMNIFIICLLGNHVSNAVQISDDTLATSNDLDDQKYHYNLNGVVYSKVHQHLYKTKHILLNMLVNKNHSNAVSNKIHNPVLLVYGYSLNFNDSSKRTIEGNQKLNMKLDEAEKNVTTSSKELDKPQSQDETLKVPSVINKYDYTNIGATRNNNYELDNNKSFKKIEIKHKVDYLKTYRHKERNLKNPTNFNSSGLLDEIITISENKTFKSSRKYVLIEQKRVISYSGKVSQNSWIASNLNLQSLKGSQEVDISKHLDSDNVPCNKTIYNTLKKGKTEEKYPISIQYPSSPIKIQQSKYDNSPNLSLLILTTRYQYPSLSIIVSTLVPRVKRSLQSGSSKELESPSKVGNFPFSTAGSSLYGSYAYAHSRPSGFGMFPPFGGEGGEPIEGGEAVEPIGGSEEEGG